MVQDGNRPNSVDASPSKRFFCEMLTRDIELKDAIMDLLDNCIDGAMRTKGDPPSDEIDGYYNGFESRIFLSQDQFAIEDNCGGIPLPIAERYAFRFGAPEEQGKEFPEALPTVGIYGIGMKRAIFKMGAAAEIFSKTESYGQFKVTIPVDWCSGDYAWEFPITTFEDGTGAGYGTTIRITDIKPSVAEDFASNVFVENLRTALSQHYSVILQKGFVLLVNDVPVLPKKLELLFSKSDESSKSQYAPYLYVAKIGKVDVNLVVGFYGRNTFPDEKTIDDEAKGTGRYASEESGITVICNDRVVLYNNKDHLTGWGENGVPRYHTQFIGIKGMLILRSNDPSLLPTTTSKRGIDLNSLLYFQVKKRMQEGIKHFTDYTNQWKGRNEEEKELSGKAEVKPIQDFISPRKEELEKRLEIIFKKGRNPKTDEYFFKPVLPAPPVEVRHRTITFSKPEEEIRIIADFLFAGEGEGIHPSTVGKRCFEIVLEKAERRIAR